MRIFAGLRTVVVTMALAGVAAPVVEAQDAFCTRCKKWHTLDGDWIGLSRIDGCPCCTANDCKRAAERAAALKNTYGPLRRRFDALTEEIGRLRASGTAVPRAKADEQARLLFELGQLELQYAILKEDCPHEVSGNVWEGFGGPVPDSPASQADEEARYRQSAAGAAQGYQGLSHAEAHDLDVVLGLFGAPSGGFAPPSVGYNGERAQVTRGYRATAAAYEAEVQRITKPDGAVDPKKAVTADVPKVKAVANESELQRSVRTAVERRLAVQAYTRAQLEAREKYRHAVAAKDKDQAKGHAEAAVQFAWWARELGGRSAQAERDAVARHQEALDSSLAEAAKKGATVPELLKRFQAEVKASGLPAHYRGALTAAGATAQELEQTRERLLALTPEAVEEVLNARRSRAKETAASVQGRDAFVLEAQYVGARSWFHRRVNK